MTTHSPIYTTDTPPNDYSTVVIGTTSIQLVPENKYRRWVTIQNISAVNIWINFGAPATTGAGSYLLLPNGVGIFQQECNSYLNCPIFAIAVSGTQSITAKDI